MTETFELPMPVHYRSREVLEFHSRDKEELAEQVRGNVIRKGLMINGVPVVLQVTINSRHAQWQVQADGASTSTIKRLLPRLEHSVRSMLGLDAPVKAFEASLGPADPLATLVARQSGLRIPQTATPFEALSWGIIGQQITVNFAVQLRSILIRLAGTQHSSGLWCYPEAATLAAFDVSTLRQNKYSQAKAETLQRMSRLVADGTLPLETWHALPPAELDVHEVSHTLEAVKGIGPWTVNYALLRGYAWADCLLQGDVAIQRALQQQLELPARPAAKDVKQLLQHYSPYRSLASAHLWASLRMAA